MPRFWRLLCLLVVFSPAYAIEVAHLYTGIVPVEDQNEPTRVKAQALALQQVLIKVSGSDALLSQTLVKDSLQKASGFVQRYQFTYDTPASDASSGAAKTLQLEVSFDQKAVDRLIQAVAAPIWGKRRPLSLMWLAVSDQSGRRLIGDDNEPTIIKEILSASRDIGVPAILPLLDLEETTNVNISDVWGRFLEPMQPWSARYGADAMVVGKLEQNTERWQGDISVLHGQFRESFSAIGDTRVSVLNQLMQQLAGFYASKYAVVIDLSKDAQQLVRVKNVYSLSDYGKVVNFLSSLQAVQQVDVAKVMANELQLSVRLIADQTAFLQAVGLDGRLVLVPESTLTSQLEFDWVVR